MGNLVMRVAAQFAFKMRATVKKRRRWYLAICPALDLASQGPTREKAIGNLKDAVRGFVVDCYERGTLDEVLKGAGFSASYREPFKASVQSGSHWLTVPIALLAHAHPAGVRQEA